MEGVSQTQPISPGAINNLPESDEEGGGNEFGIVTIPNSRPSKRTKLEARVFTQGIAKATCLSIHKHKLCSEGMCCNFRTTFTCMAIRAKSSSHDCEAVKAIIKCTCARMDLLIALMMYLGVSFGKVQEEQSSEDRFQPGFDLKLNSVCSQQVLWICLMPACRHLHAAIQDCPRL